MIIQASNGCFLTRIEEAPFKEIKFEKSMLVASMQEAMLWKEIPESEKIQMEAENSIYQPESVDYDYLKKVDALKQAISEKINESVMPVEQALEMVEYFPTWDSLIGKAANVGFRFQYNETLYEVIKNHSFAEEWKPDSGTESLYQVVQIEASGTMDDPIMWKYNMELFEGKYYIDKDVLYLCIRNSGMGMAYDNLANLVNGGFVKVVDDTEEIPTEPSADGTLENPIPYVKEKTSVEKDKYYIENGIIYKAIQNAGVLIYDLAQVPAIAQKVG